MTTGEKEELGGENEASRHARRSGLHMHPNAKRALDLAARINYLRDRLAVLEPQLEALLAPAESPQPETEVRHVQNNR